MPRVLISLKEISLLLMPLSSRLRRVKRKPWILNSESCSRLRMKLWKTASPFDHISQEGPFECSLIKMSMAGGIRMEDIAGSQTSCYVGCFTKDYSEMITRDPENGPMYHATGNGASILSNRLSWFFDLKGPSITLDTACSSSLVSLHLACQSLRTGESNMVGC